MQCTTTSKNVQTEPVLEEFIPLKKCKSDGDDFDVGDDKNEESATFKREKESSNDKKNWMSSVQLWSSDNNHHQHHQTTTATGAASITDINHILDSKQTKIKVKQAEESYLGFFIMLIRVIESSDFDIDFVGCVCVVCDREMKRKICFILVKPAGFQLQELEHSCHSRPTLVLPRRKRKRSCLFMVVCL